MKRFLTLILVLGLAIASPGPLSLCALAAPMSTECAPPQPLPECHRMQMATEPAPVLNAPAGTCCVSSQAPLPEAKNELISPAGEQDLANLPVAAAPVFFENYSLRNIPQDTSPPPLQTLLCTFLI